MLRRITPVRLNTGHVNPLLGMSYIQFAMEGLRHQLSQGAGGWSVEPGDRYTYYKLVDSVIPPATDKDGHEKDFFDGIDTSLRDLISRFDAPARNELARSRSEHCGGGKSGGERSGQCGGAVVRRWSSSLGRLEGRLRASEQYRQNEDRLTRLIEKESQARSALNLALNLSLQATLVSPQGSRYATGAGRRPAGRDFSRPEDHRQSEAAQRLDPCAATAFAISRRPGRRTANRKSVFLQCSRERTIRRISRWMLPPNTPSTRPALHRNDPERDGVYTVDEPRYQTLPFPPPPFRVSVHYDVPAPRLSNSRCRAKTPETLPEISAPVLVAFTDEQGAEQKRPLAVVPAFSVELEPGEQIIPIANGSERSVKVGVSSNLTGVSSGNSASGGPAGLAGRA